MPTKNTFGLNIKGLDELTKLLNDLPLAVNQKIQKDVNRKAAAIAKKQLEQDAPEGNNDSKSENKLASNVIVSADNGSKTGWFVGFKKKVFWVFFIEKGTKIRSVGKKKNGKYKSGNRGSIIGKPFVEQSYETSSTNIIDYLSTNYLKLINNAIKKQVKKFKK